MKKWQEILSRNHQLSFFYEKCRADFRTKFLFSDHIIFLFGWKNPDNGNVREKITTTKISAEKNSDQIFARKF
jgi:hypothetical protein